MKLSSEEKERIKKARERLNAFYSGKKKKFFFEVDCALEVRIKYIYGVIFPGLKRLAFFGRFLVARIAQYTDISAVKVFLYRRMGFKIGKGVFISPDVILDPHFPRLIEIEDYAILGWGTHLFPHEFSGTKYRMGRIHIGRGAVIGGFSTIRGGVTIGENADVSALSLVYQDVPKNYLVDSVVVLNKALCETYREKRGL